MSSAALKRKTWGEYRELERVSEVKHEFYDGEIFAMSGGSAKHSLIGMNVGRHVGNALESGGCQVHGSDMLIWSPAGMGSYPDCSIVCGEPQYLNEDEDTLLNPIVIFEVLSPSTEAYDRGRKFQRYQAIESLKEYVLIAQSHVRVDHFARQQTSGQWLLTTYSDIEETLLLPAIGVEIKLNDIYRGVEVDTLD